MTEYAPTSAEFGLVEGTRRLRGLLLPFGVRGQNANGYFEFGPGVIELPADPTTARLALNHGGQEFGHAAVLEETNEGIVAEFDIHEGVIGDRFLDEYRQGRKHNLSAEFAAGVKRAADNVTAIGAALTGAAAVVLGGFAGAQFFELAEVTVDEETGEITAEPITPDESGDVALTVSETPESVTVTVDGIETVFEPRPAEDTEEPIVGSESEFNMAEATVPGGSTLSAPAHKDTSFSDLFSLITRARRGDSDAHNAIIKMGATGDAFALNDVKYDGTGGTALTRPPQFLGQLWSASKRERHVIPAFTSGNLTDTTVKGWKFGTEPEVSTWAGNKANVPSSTITVAEVPGAMQRFAGGNDIAREYYDFGKTEVVEALIAAYIDSYKVKSDEWFLDLLVAAATGVPVSVPAGTPEGVGKVVQGSLALVGNGASPSIAFVAPDVYSSIAFTKKDDTLEFLTTSLNRTLEDGTTLGFRIQPTNYLAAGQVLVADRNAATALELPGSPIRVNALDMAKGGVDEAIFGYIGGIVNDANGLALVENAGGA